MNQQMQDAGAEYGPCRAKPRGKAYRVAGVLMGLMGCLVGALSLYFIFYALNNFWFGMTWEYLTLGVMLAACGLGMLALAWYLYSVGPRRDAQRMRDMERACHWYLSEIKRP